jgi:hypothetical protein
MSSETSSEMKVSYHDNHGKKIAQSTEVKRQTTDTDFYFNMVANQEKIIPNDEESSESSQIIASSRSSKSSKSSKSSDSSKSSSDSKKSSESRVERLDLSDNKQPSYIKIPNNIPINQHMNSNNNHFNSSNNNNFNSSNNNSHFNSSNNNSHFSNSNNNNFHNPVRAEMPRDIPSLEPVINTQSLNPQEIRMKKIELLRRLCEIKAKGFQLTKEYDFNSSIEEMEYEYALLKSFADKRNGIKLYKSFLLNGVSLLEFMNDKYDPFDFKLNGWSEHMSVEVDSYDDVLEELYEKYKTSGGSWPPEAKLAMLLVGSGAGYHFTKTQLGSIPGGINPGAFLGKMMSGPGKKTSQFMSPQEINIENQKKALKEKELQMKQQQKDKMRQQMNTDTEQMSSMSNMPNLNSMSGMPSMPSMSGMPNIHMSNSRDAPEIRAPENVKDILARIKNIQQQGNINSVNTTETQDELSSNNDRLLSDTTISTSDNKKRGRKPINKKPIISVST